MNFRPRRGHWETLAHFCLCGVLVLVCAGALAPVTHAQQRIVAVGDVHGNLEGFVQILQQAGLLDSARKWSGGNATLVQTGDSIDRGPEMRGVLDFLMALEKQAPKAGGRVISLIGNHEAMNIYGDMRYVVPENYASFADANSEKRRLKAWEQYVEWRKKVATARNQPAPVMDAATRAQWFEAHPLGFLEHREAFGPAGKYGKWLREKQAMLRIGSTGFLHGGISTDLAAWKLEDVNKRIASEIAAYDNYRQAFVQQGLALPFFTIDELAAAITSELNFRKQAIETKRQAAAAEEKTYQPSAEEMKALEPLETFLTFPTWFMIHTNGPLWFRGYGTWSDEEGPANLDRLAGMGVTQWVVGHTPQLQGGMRMRFGGRVFLIDTGILSTYYKGGVLSALEISGSKYTAIYSDRRVALHDASAAGTPAASHSFQHDPLAEDSAGPLGGGAEREQAPKAAQASPEPAAVSPAPRAIPAPARVWYGKDGNPLPLQSDEDILNFLATATVKSWKDVGAGINNPKKMLLEKDGIELSAVFREVDEEKDDAKMATGRREVFFRDSYLFEIAAYKLSRLLGLDNVPPTIKRKINGANGSLQLWVENAFTEAKRQKEKIRPADVSQWNRQVQVMHAFDALIYNTDRNMGNVLIDKNWKLWMIDHTRAFRRYSELLEPDKIVLVNREFYEALKALDPLLIRATLKDSLRGHEIEGLLRRREALIAFIPKVIAERGEEKAIFTWKATK